MCKTNRYKATTERNSSFPWLLFSFTLTMLLKENSAAVLYFYNSPLCFKSLPPAQLVVCSAPRRGFYQLASKDALNGLPTVSYSLATAKAVYFLPVLTCSPVNGSMYSFSVIWSAVKSSCI